MDYYIQRHESGYLGNAPIWWCKNGYGYSAYLEKAERFTEQKVIEICGVPIGEKGEKYKAWPCDFIDERTHTVFDMQSFFELEQWYLKNE